MEEEQRLVASMMIESEKDTEEKRKERVRQEGEVNVGE